MHKLQTAVNSERKQDGNITHASALAKCFLDDSQKEKARQCVAVMFIWKISDL